MILIIQNDSATSGTLLSQPLDDRDVGKWFTGFSCRSEWDVGSLGTVT
jgi:hypothetical protein